MRTQRIQRFGRLLSGMVMPNIGAYIAWGLLTALFIPTGWVPNESLARLVNPMIFYLLPLLIGYTGGKIIYGQRGGVLGAVVTMGAIVGTSTPMIFGAMVAGPFAGWLIKKFDEFVGKQIPTGFEMLVNNFSGGIHEIYFPYVLMQPKLLAAVIAGGGTGVLTFSMLGAGLVAVPSPGSIVTLVAMTPKGGLLPVLAGVVTSALVTFIVGSCLIDRKAGESKDELTRAKEKMVKLKGAKVLLGHDCIPDDLSTISTVKLIAVACDGGMGSSAIGASKLRAVFTEAGIDLKVISCPIEQLDSPIDLVITHEQLTNRAVHQHPSAIHIAITNFINTPVYEELADRIAAEKIDTRMSLQKRRKVTIKR